MNEKYNFEINRTYNRFAIKILNYGIYKNIRTA